MLNLLHFLCNLNPYARNYRAWTDTSAQSKPLGKAFKNYTLSKKFQHFFNIVFRCFLRFFPKLFIQRFFELQNFLLAVFEPSFIFFPCFSPLSFSCQDLYEFKYTMSRNIVKIRSANFCSLSVVTCG